jgi:G3E family GTPase
MSESREGRMRLMLLGGFLGSGKTTWLRHQLHEGLLDDAHVIVNEAAATPVDDALLKGMSSMEVLAGGCACCEARDELVARLKRLCDLRSGAASSEARLERVALETSGLADPAAILEAIGTHPVLVHHIVVSETIVCVDALHGLAQFRSEPLSRRQAAVADRLIVTKLDEADAGETARLVATVRRLNPGARIEGAIKGSPVSLEPSPDAEPETLPDLDGVPSDPIFPTRLVIGDGVDWTAFGVWLSALLYARGDDVMRVKGVVRTPAGRLLLQSVRKVVQSPEILPPQDDRDDDAIVVIGRGYQSVDLLRSLERFAGLRSPVAWK